MGSAPNLRPHPRADLDAMARELNTLAARAAWIATVLRQRNGLAKGRTIPLRSTVACPLEHVTI